MALYGATLSDIQKRLDSDNKFVDIIETIKGSNPLLDDMVNIEGDLPIGNRTTVRTSYPAPSIRRYNQGIAPTKSGVKTEIDTCANLEARSKVDVELLKGKPNPELYRKSEDLAHVEGMSDYVAGLMLYGNKDVDPELFNGFMTRLSRLNDGTATKGDYAYQVVEGGTANEGAHNTSILIADWGDKKVAAIYPKGMTAGLDMQDLGEGDTYDADGKAYRALQTLYNWKVGLAVSNVRSIAAVRNIDAAGLATITSANAKKLMDRIVFAKNRLQNPKNPIMYMSDDMYSYLEIFLMDKANVHVTRDERTGAMPFLRFAGIPVRKMSCMVNNESPLE